MKNIKKWTTLFLALMLLTGCGGHEEEPESPPPEETGYSATGRDNPNVDKNEYRDDNFIQVGGFTMYTGGNGASHIGIDVSSHQKEVDWSQVAASGVQFVMIRAGFRGYTGGGIYQDEYFQANLEGALSAGLKVGVYFFSQAINPEEAREEARQTLAWLEGYEVTYPVVYDWEEIPHDTARTDEVEPEMVTECIKAFCEEVEASGHTAMVYFNRRQGYEIMDLEQLEGYEFWLAGYSTYPDFQYDFEMWQYSCTGMVPGIETEVDLDICLTDYPLERPAEGEGEVSSEAGESSPETSGSVST